MEDDKKLSASSEENPKEMAEDVQQEAESPNEITLNPEEQLGEYVQGEDLHEASSAVDPSNDVDTEEEESLPQSTGDELDTGSEEIATEEKTSDIPQADNQESNEENDIAQSTATESPEVNGEVADTSKEEQHDDAEELIPNASTEESKDGQPEREPIKSEDTTDSDDLSVADASVDEHEKLKSEFADVSLEGLGKTELVGWVKKIAGVDDFRVIDHLFKDLGSRYDEMFGEERKRALEAFLSEEGNEESDFEYHGDDLDKEFQTLYENLRYRRSHYFHQLEKEKEENLIRKEQILDMIRGIVDGEDQASFNKVRKLQEDWKKVGPVPGAQNRTLWANYHALMDRFYDQRTIYFELKDLDRKKNLKAKLELCERAESLDPEKDLKSAIMQLNELHEEFKHIGAVPKEDQEPLWQRFKAASDKVYEHRKEFTEHQKKEHKKNLEIKEDLARQAEDFVSFNSDRIKDWNQKTKALLELQKKWEACGGVPRDKAKTVNKAFWGNFKKFFANKNQFFKQLDSQKDENLKKKQELVAQALELRESSEWDKTTQAMKQLQSRWKEIGPVPEKFRKSIYDEFKEHCDHFFDRRRGLNVEQNQEFEENLARKTLVLDQLEELSKSDAIDMDIAYSMTEQFSEIGLVPRNAVASVLTRYEKIGDTILNSGQLSDSEADEFKMHLEICKLRNTPHGNQKINRKENALRRRITGLENDINNWRTNMDFFASSKNADQLKGEFETKIVEAENELESLKKQLRQLR